MPARASGWAFNMTTNPKTTRTTLEAVGVLTDPRDDEPFSVETHDDRGDVNGEDGHPDENDQQAEHATQTERREADETRQHAEREQDADLGHHQHDAMLGVPLNLEVLSLDEER